MQLAVSLSLAVCGPLKNLSIETQNGRRLERQLGTLVERKM